MVTHPEMHLGGIWVLNKKSGSSIAHHHTSYVESTDGQPGPSSSVQSIARAKCHSKGSQWHLGFGSFSSAFETKCLLPVRAKVAPVTSKSKAWHDERCSSVAEALEATTTTQEVEERGLDCTFEGPMCVPHCWLSSAIGDMQLSEETCPRFAKRVEVDSRTALCPSRSPSHLCAK